MRKQFHQKYHTVTLYHKQHFIHMKICLWSTVKPNFSSFFFPNSFITNIKLKAKDSFFITAMLFYTLKTHEQNWHICWRSIAIHHVSIPSGTSVTAASQICEVKLLLMSVGNWKVWHWSSLQWHNTICSLMKLGQLVEGGGGTYTQDTMVILKSIFFLLERERTSFSSNYEQHLVVQKFCNWHRTEKRQ